MSMHNQSEASFDRINKSMPENAAEREPDEAKSKKRCIIIVLLVCILAAAITALILVLVFKGGSSVPKGYNGYSSSDQNDGMWFFQASLQRTRDVTIPVERDDSNIEFENLKMRVSMMNDHTVRMRITPVKNATGGVGEAEEIKRWEVPDDLMGNMKDDYGMRLTWADFSFSKDPAGLELKNTNNGHRYLSTKNRNLVFTDKYLEQGFLLDSRHIFGFGERQNQFELKEGEYSSWANGRDNHFDKGVLGGHSYGDHPFVLAKLNKGGFVGIFFKNSNSKVMKYQHTGKDQSILNFIATGGVLDFFTFFAEKPEEVIKAYHQVIGVPALVPFWSLGFQQSSWQYKSQDQVSDVMKKYDEAMMPLEGMWLDIEYMDMYRNFLVDKSRFPKMTELAKDLHDKDQKLIVIVDAGFAADEGYDYYKDADEDKLFIKSSQNTLFNGNLIGKVWPGKSAFLDFHNPKTTDFWVNGLNSLYGLTQMDAIWIDMNEVTTFCDGECPGPDPDPELTYGVNNNTLPFNATGNVSLLNYSISIDATHYAATEDEKALNIEYNMHSLYGVMEARATNAFWTKTDNLKDKLPFVLSRSTFAGAGKWTAHWLGDNFSTWEFMKLSISGIMDFNMFGIPMVGADVCGFHNAYDDEMCGRWMQLSAFYPFARNHYNLTDYGKELPPQEPYLLKEPYKTMAQRAIIQRY